MKHENPSRGSRRPLASDHLHDSARLGSAAPAVLVVFELESAPRVVACWDTDADDARMTVWLDSREDYAELLHKAVELSGEAA